MKSLNTPILEVFDCYGVSQKQAKMVLLCVVLLLAKFLIVPVLQWQSELQEETSFYTLQLRDEESISGAVEQLEKSIAHLDDQVNIINKQYFQGSKTALQVHLNDKIAKQAQQLELKLSSRNSKELQTVEGITTFEYNISLRGTSKPLQEFLYWLDTQEPKLLVKSMRFSSVGRTANADLILRIHQLAEVTPG
ncbi:GspMb/PilO family protein [Pseudoalteromonas sp. GB56]